MTLIIDVSFPKSSKSQRIVLEQGQELLIGRTNEKILLGPDPRLSRRHFSLRRVEGGFEISHLSKTNPTLLAPEQSRDFQSVSGTLLQAESCRVIAGSHRFVLTLEKAETLEHDSLPPADIHGLWSDVEEQSEDAENHSVDPTRQTRPKSGGVAPFRFDDSLDEQEARRELQQDSPERHFFDSEDDSAHAPVEVDPKPSKQQPEKPARPKSKSKPHVPLDFNEPTVTSSASSSRAEDNPKSKPAENESEQVKSKDAKRSKDKPPTPTGKKMIFPVGDNFFDD